MKMGLNKRLTTKICFFILLIMTYGNLDVFQYPWWSSRGQVLTTNIEIEFVNNWLRFLVVFFFNYLNAKNPSKSRYSEDLKVIKKHKKEEKK